jgi:hypothetical protein
MSEMYAIVLCASCKRKRIADLRAGTSQCPYCGVVSRTDGMAVLFSDKSQSVVREVFENADSSNYPEPRKKRENDPDPLSTLVYEYEHASGTLEKLTVLADGLDRIKGTFKESDIEELFPGEGKKIVKMMISADIIIEFEYGTFRTI